MLNSSRIIFDTFENWLSAQHHHEHLKMSHCESKMYFPCFTGTLNAIPREALKFLRHELICKREGYFERSTVVCHVQSRPMAQALGYLIYLFVTHSISLYHYSHLLCAQHCVRYWGGEMKANCTEICTGDY